MNNCTLCGEPMQAGEEMFKFHGSLGPCPKPPLPKPMVAAVVEYFRRDDGGLFWVDVRVDRNTTHDIGPFDSAASRDAALNDMLAMIRSTGGVDLPARPQ